MAHDEILVVFSSGKVVNGDIETIKEIDAEDMIEALDIASNLSNWKGVGFVTIWNNAFVDAQFFAHTEAVDAHNAAIGRA